MTRAVLLIAALALSALACAAQNASGAFMVSGVVRSAATGASLDRAEVTLSTAGEQETRIAETITGEDGAFRFAGLAAGKYALAASRRGYLSARYQEHEGGYSTAIVTGEGLVSDDLRFDLFPIAIIGGAITDDSGDPVAGAQVTLYRQQQQDGEIKVARADAESTSDDGTYEFDRLRRGTYYIGVSANPWYAFRPPIRGGTDGMTAPEPQPRSPLDVAYPTSFYASATDSGSATPIQLNPGDHPSLNLTLHAVPAVHVTIMVPTPDFNRSVSIPQLEQDVFGTEQFQAPGNSVITTNGDRTLIDIGSVAPGQYQLRDFGPDGSNRSATIDLTDDQTVDLRSRAATVVVSGRLEMASGRPLPPMTILQLVSEGSTATLTAPVKADGSFDLQGVAPGEYTAKVASSSGTLNIAQMAASGAEMHGHRITIASDPVLLAATLARGSVSVSGFARRDGKGVGGALILLVPDHLEDNAELVRQDQSDSDGSFTLNRVPPGNYTVVAIENGWSLEWSRPEAIAPYLAHGVKVHITGSQAGVELPSPVDVQ